MAETPPLAPSRPVVIIHSRAQALAAAVVAAEMERPVMLATAPGAAAYLGPSWLPLVLDAVRARVPRADVEGLLDCGDRPGDVLAALRQGTRHLRFTGRKAVAGKLAEICAAEGATLYRARLKGLDLLDEADPEDACRRWLGKA